MDLILASTSSYRRAQLEQIGAVFECVSPDFDEEAEKDLTLAPEDMAAGLALGKAESLRLKYPGAAILGGDQLVVCEGEVLGKPGSAGAALQQLLKMSGKTHQLLTSICLITPQRVYQHIDVALMTMRDLSRQQLQAYIEFDSPLDCAGSYKLECAGIGLFDGIKSEDFSAIQGLPLITLRRWFADLSLPSRAFGCF